MFLNRHEICEKYFISETKLSQFVYFEREREEIFFHIFRALISEFFNFGLDLQKKVPNHASEYYLPKENMLRIMIWQFSLEIQVELKNFLVFSHLN